MISLKIGTTTERRTVLVEPNAVLGNVLSDNNISITGAALHLNGNLIPTAAIEDSLADLGVADGTEASLIAVVKADSAK